MDATGASAFSSLALCPLLALLWYLQRFSAREMGFTWGGVRALQGYGLAVLYPVAVGAIAAATGAMHSGAAPHYKHSHRTRLRDRWCVLRNLQQERGRLLQLHWCG